MKRTKTQDARGGSISFSLRAHPGDIIEKRYTAAKLLNIAVTSPFRHDLKLLDILLAGEEENMTSDERKKMTEIVRTLALSQQIRTERTPTREDIIRYLRAADKGHLVSMIANSTNVRLFLIANRARDHAARIEDAKLKEMSSAMADLREVGGGGSGGSGFDSVGEVVSGGLE